MKKMSLWLSALLFAAILCPAASVFADKGMMGGAMMEKGAMSSMYPKMMEERKEMMDSMMAMMKETMGIVKSMNHTPSVDQKKRLDEMMSKLDEMIKKHDAMHEEMSKRMMERREQKGK